MTSQSFWIGITVTVFFVGLAIGYFSFGGMNNGNMMMNDPQAWMEDNQHAEEMAAMMRDDHDFAMEMMSVMIEDPSIRIQMIGHLTENPEAMQQISSMMDSGMQSQEMMMATMTDADQMTLMEDMMKVMMNKMQTDPELEQAMMEHMERMKSSRDAIMGTDNFMLNGVMDTKINPPSREIQQKIVNLGNEFGLCTSDWYITGYFLPIESDYSGKSVEIPVAGNIQFYLTDFLDAVKIEGWGKTNAGNYLGWHHGAFTLSDRYLDAYNNDLIVGMVAVDDSVIEHGTELTIPTLPEPWNDVVFSGLDEGPSINGKHIDVFTGEGIDAENETFRITSANNTVCIQN